MSLRAASAAAAVASVAFLNAVTPASASILRYDWTGTVVSGSDVSGVFGAAGSNLAGDVYAATFLFDDTMGTTVSLPGLLAQLNGGLTNYVDLSPALTTTLTINGKTASFFGAGQGNVSNFPLASEVSTDSFASLTASPYDASFLEEQLDQANAPSTLEANFTSTGQAGAQNQFQIAQGQPLVSGSYAFGVLAPTSVSERVIAAAPEPSTWALMVIGVGLLGSALRRRVPRLSGRTYA